MATGVYPHKPNQGFQKGHKQFVDPATLRGRHLSPNTEFKKGITPWNKGKKGVMPVPWNKGTKGRMKGFWAGKKRPEISIRFKGARHPRWKGGCYEKIETAIRHSPDYKEWRRHVFQRDDYTCQSCGERGGELHADHEFPFAYFPALRFEILNGRTLCKSCHLKTPTYGHRVSNIYPQDAEVEAFLLVQ